MRLGELLGDEVVAALGDAAWKVRRGWQGWLRACLLVQRLHACMPARPCMLLHAGTQPRVRMHARECTRPCLIAMHCVFCRCGWRRWRAWRRARPTLRCQPSTCRCWWRAWRRCRAGRKRTSR